METTMDIDKIRSYTSGDAFFAKKIEFSVDGDYNMFKEMLSSDCLILEPPYTVNMLSFLNYLIEDPKLYLKGFKMFSPVMLQFKQLPRDIVECLMDNGGMRSIINKVIALVNDVHLLEDLYSELGRNKSDRLTEKTSKEVRILFDALEVCGKSIPDILDRVSFDDMTLGYLRTALTDNKFIIDALLYIEGNYTINHVRVFEIFHDELYEEFKHYSRRIINTTSLYMNNMTPEQKNDFSSLLRSIDKNTLPSLLIHNDPVQCSLLRDKFKILFDKYRS